MNPFIKYRKFGLVILLQCIGLAGFTINAPVTRLDSLFPCPFSQVTFPVKVDNFSNIGAITLTIQYDSTVMLFDRTNSAVNPVFSGAILNEAPLGSGSALKKILIVWSALNPVTLPNGSIVATLKFSYLGGSAALTFDNSSNGGTLCEFADSAGVQLLDTPSDIFYHNGFVSPFVPVSASITATSDTVCQGSMVTFTATSANTNGNATYSWFVNGNLMATSLSCGSLVNGLVACYPFNGNAYDESGNGSNGTVLGPTLTTDRFGNPNSAYLFDGNGDYIVCDADNLPITDRTVSLWFYANSLGTHPNPLAYGGNNCGTTWFQSINHTGPEYVLESHCEVNHFAVGYTTAPVGQWVNWVITNDVTGCKMFINGVQIGSNSNYVDDTYVTGKDLAIGVCVSTNGMAPYTDWNLGWFDGKIDDVRIYDRALSLQEILSLYSATDSTFNYVPSDGDTVYCVVNSGISCPPGDSDTSNMIIMTVNPQNAVSIAISASANPFISGTSVTFTAIPWNGGSVPVYQWIVNGIMVGTNANTYTYNPVHGDQVSCTLYSSLDCLSEFPAVSNTIFMTAASASPCPGIPSFTINHLVSGGVAPVDKTVMYGTATNIPGEPTRCWITSNLGSDHQAVACMDGTEASRGWFWQFNRKQGYKHDGTTITPSWTITSIMENLDWLAINDPCTLELGSGWRIPTSTEWYNVDAYWSTWHDAWNSDLKLHYAGSLSPDSSPFYFGQIGFYWGSTQQSLANSWFLYFDGGNGCYPSIYSKSYGMPLRCLKDPVGSLLPTVSTTPVSSITQNTVISGGNVTSDGGAAVTSRGVCWSTFSNPTISDSHTFNGTGTGTFTSNLNGLSPNTLFYLRAYATNSVGTAYGNEVSFTTLLYWACGAAITINHVAGAIAPVDKTTTYGTVTNIPGEPEKCWITSNLGSDRQAFAANDPTEPSAGWYWQFNRKQGYKNNGTSFTPAWTINFILENSNWLYENDPCAIEIGSGWRIPTSSEWYNVDDAGNWYSWYGPWNSELKLHSAGTLNSSGGFHDPGGIGNYWSSTQYDAYNGGFLFLDGGNNSYLGNAIKSCGMTLRCLSDPVTAALPTVTTSVVSNITQNTAIGGGDVTSEGGAGVTDRGICWSTSPNPTISDSHTTNGSGQGVFVSNLTGLPANTLCYLRAYATNSVGTAYGNEVSFTTLSYWSCGATITINHVAGTIAPVDKTTTYGTVTNIPGEPGKCWITSNLGADRQAYSVHDGTELSSGWFWQFNLKQGYKNDGGTLTPAWTITSINENTDWQDDNDPCSLELDSVWHIPTYTEWFNVDAIGNWVYWYGPWFSDLKLHFAGSLNASNGSAFYHGDIGLYWSNTQNNPSNGWYLYFDGGNPCYVVSIDKACGLPLRCITGDCSFYDTVNISIGASANTVCQGTTVTYTATIENGGTTPVFQWKINGNNVGTSTPTYSYCPANNDVITCILTSNATCITGNTDTSNVITMIVNPISPVGISISASGDTLCQGTPVTFTASATNTGSDPTYAWYVNGTLMSSSQSCVSLINGLAACYPFNGNASDNSGNGNNGTINGASLTANRFGRANSAFAFDGMNDEIVVPNSPTLNPDSISISCWIKPDTLYCFNTILAKGGNASGYGVTTQYNLYNCNLFHYLSSDSYCPYYQFSSTNPLNQGVWQHLVLTHTGTQVKFYKNGVLDSQTNTGPSLASPTPQSLYIGTESSHRPYDVFFHGVIDDVSIYSRILSANEVLTLYHAGDSTFTYSPADGDSVYCVVTSSDSCTTNNPDTSNVVIMTVTPNLPVSISISASANPVYSGATVTFTATPTNAGSSPVYQWKVNGIMVGASSPVYSYEPQNGDSVSCSLVSSIVCISMSPAFSNTLFMVVLMGIPCPGIPTVDYGGETYHTVQIGTQCWLIENLNIGTMISGSENAADNGIIEKYCYFNNPDNCNIYGGLYTWNEMMQYSTTPGTQGICPSGWLIPKDNEYCILTAFLDATTNCTGYGWTGTNAGGKMKEPGLLHWCSPNTGATNESGFKALPAGTRYPSGNFYSLTNAGIFWTSSPNDLNSSHRRDLDYNRAEVLRDIQGNEFGFSVRCIRDTCPTYAPVGIIITPSANPVCAATSVTFTATPTNGGSLPTY
ncbi:MAG: LamG-like jellyroll fold domain-containing protein, partial [Bacteroidota bacterium]